MNSPQGVDGILMSNVNILMFWSSRPVGWGFRHFVLIWSLAILKLVFGNTTSVAYINHFGGCRSVRCNAIAQDIWAFCRLRSIWLTAAHLPGHLNVLADERSRLFDEKTEWKLNPCVFKHVVQRFGTPTIDLFASRLNFQL